MTPSHLTFRNRSRSRLWGLKPYKSIKHNGCDPAAENILTNLDAHIRADTNETFERYKFNTRAQKPDESIDDYLASLKTLAKTCNFCQCLKTSLSRNRIVLGVIDKPTRKRLLQEGKLTLKKALGICRSYEKTANQLKFIAGKEEAEVHRTNLCHQLRNKPTTRPSCNRKFCGTSHTVAKPARQFGHAMQI